MSLFIRKIPSNVIVHSDRGSQNCSNKYQYFFEIAIKVGNAAITEKLIDYGAQINTYDKNGLLPIQNYLSYLFYMGQYTKEDYISKLYELLSKDSL